MDSERASAHRIVHNFSRRDLFRTTGFTAGSAMLFGIPRFLGGWLSDAQTATAPRTSSAGNIPLELDGAFVGYRETVEGGNAFADVVPDSLGPDLIQRMWPGPVKIEDIVFEVPLGGDTKPLANWITEMLAKGPAPKNEAIVYADLNNAEVKAGA